MVGAKFQLRWQRGTEAGLVRLTDVGALLDFDHLDFLEDLEAVTTGDQQNSITRR